MSLFGNSDRGDGYYQPDSLTNSTEQYEAPQSHAHFRVPNSSARDGGTFLHPKNSLPPLQPTSNYSSPTVMIPPVSHQKHQYGPISNSSLQTTPSSLSYVEHGSGSGYTNAQYSGTPYSLTGKFEHCHAQFFFLCYCCVQCSLLIHHRNTRSSCIASHDESSSI